MEERNRGGRSGVRGINSAFVPNRSITTIGTFDGVHRGHAALLGRARRLADERGARVVVMAFDPHPLTALRPEAAPARLTSWEDRERLLKVAGADEVVRLRPVPAVLGLSAEEFIAHVVADVRPMVLVEGPDFHFGRGRAGNVGWLGTVAPRFGFELEVLEPVTVVLNDHSIVPASSTMTRWLLRHGRVADAARVLGRPHTLSGTVERGDQRGRTIGFPTANLRTAIMPPGDGVYAARAILPDGAAVPAAVHVGPRPTFNAHEPTVEAHLLDPVADRAWVKPGELAEYGWGLRLELLGFLREALVFSGVQSLTDQLRRDCQRARAVFDAAAADQPLAAGAQP